MFVTPGLGALPGQQAGVAAAGRQPDDLEAVGVGGDDVQRLGADGAGAAEYQYSGSAHRPIVPCRGAHGVALSRCLAAECGVDARLTQKGVTQAHTRRWVKVTQM